MTIAEQFDQAVQESKQLSERPSNEILLKLYGLFKQATDGDNNAERPTGFDFKAIAKHDAWASMKGKTHEDCMTKYTELVQSLK